MSSLTPGQLRQVRVNIREAIDRLRPRESATGRYAHNLAPEFKFRPGGGIDIDPEDGGLVVRFEQADWYDSEGLMLVEGDWVTLMIDSERMNSDTDVFDTDPDGSFQITEAGTICLEAHVTLGEYQDEMTTAPEFEFEIVIEKRAAAGGSPWIEVPGTRRYGGAGVVFSVI